MNYKLKELFLGMVLVVVCNVFSMDPNVRMMVRASNEMWEMVTAKNLDHNALTTGGLKFLFINDRDYTGRTPLHCLMKHKDAKVEHVEFFIKKGACLDIEDNRHRDPYVYSFNHRGHTPESESLHNCDRKVVHFLHSEMLLPKLEDLAFMQRVGIKY